MCILHSNKIKGGGRRQDFDEKIIYRNPVAMGNAQASHPDDARFASATRNFAAAEIEALETLFASLAAQSGSADAVSSTTLNSYFRIRGSLADKLFDEITQGRPDRRLTFRDFVLAKSALEKASPAEIDEFVYRLLDVDGDRLVRRSDLEAALASVLVSLFPDADTSAASTAAFVDAAALSEAARGGEPVLSFEDFKSWCRLLPSLRKFLGSMLAVPDSGRPGFQVPHLLHPDHVDPESLLMKKEFAWHIAGAIPSERTEQWELLYNSSVNGLSFNTFLGCVGHAPTVVLIKDRQGWVYGGYASQPWEKHGDFYGDVKCFLFQLHPRASLYRATGLNGNYQWCAANFSSESIPNGIGFGGRVGHFGLFVAGSFDQGHSFVCTTFNSPCLGESSRIWPEVVECWGVEAVKEKDDLHPPHLKGTVLERFKEDRHMLNMVGLANSSE